MSRASRYRTRNGAPAGFWLRGAACSAGAAVTALTLPSAVSAHVTMQFRDTVEASGTSNVVFAAPGEHKLPMTSLSISLPAGMEVIDAAEPGWRVTRSRGSIRWTGGQVPAFGTASFRLRARFPERPGVHRFVAAQRYADGHEDRWTLPFRVFANDKGHEQHVIAAALAAAVGIPLVVAIVILRSRWTRGRPRT